MRDEDQGAGAAEESASETEAADPNTREIGGVTYRTQPIGFSKGLPLLKRLVDILAPIAAAALRGGSVRGQFANVLDVAPQAFTEKDLERFAEAFGPLSAYLDEATGKWVTLVKNPKIDNRERHFTGRYGEFMQWLVFCIEVNFAGFFSGAIKQSGDGNPLQALTDMIAPKPKSPKSPASDSGTTSNTA